MNHLILVTLLSLPFVTFAQGKQDCSEVSRAHITDQTRMGRAVITQFFEIPLLQMVDFEISRYESWKSSETIHCNANVTHYADVSMTYTNDENKRCHRRMTVHFKDSFVNVVIADREYKVRDLSDETCEPESIKQRLMRETCAITTCPSGLMPFIGDDCRCKNPEKLINAVDKKDLYDGFFSEKTFNKPDDISSLFE